MITPQENVKYETQYIWEVMYIRVEPANMGGGGQFWL